MQITRVCALSDTAAMRVFASDRAARNVAIEASGPTSNGSSLAPRALEGWGIHVNATPIPYGIGFRYELHRGVHEDRFGRNRGASTLRALTPLRLAYRASLSLQAWGTRMLVRVLAACLPSLARGPTRL